MSAWLQRGGGIGCLRGVTWLVTSLLVIFLQAGCGPKIRLEELDTGGRWRHLDFPRAPFPLSQELNILVWEGYLPEDVIDHFEETYKVKINVELISGNEEIYTKITRPGAHYDLIMPGTYMVQQLIREQRLRVIDHARIPNLHQISPDYFELEFDPALKHAVPIYHSTVGLAMNVKYAQGLPLTWPEFAVETDQPLAHGRIAIPDEMRVVLGTALLMIGHSPNTRNPAEIAQARDMLISVKADTGLLFHSDRMPDALAKEEAIIAIAWSGDAGWALTLNGYVRFIVPRGSSISELDSLCVPVTARHPETAEFFINYLLIPEITGALTNYSHYANTNPASRAFIDPRITNGPSYMVPLADGMVFLEDVGDARAHYVEAWNAVKAAPDSLIRKVPLPFASVREHLTAP